jgi:signal transduction histidine kinase/DNA-binding response OmpR family regulator
MKLRNLKISTRLYFSLGLLIVFVIALGAVAWQQTGSMWQQTKTMYDHPLPVSRAIRDFKVDVVSIERDLNELVLTSGEQMTAELLQAIEVYQADASQQLDILQELYLGAAEDVTDLRRHFVEWSAAREETLRLLRQGMKAEAAATLAAIGQDGAYTELEQNAEAVQTFAIQKADELFAEAAATRHSLNIRLIIVIAVILLFCLLLSWALLTAIRQPLRQVANAADQFRKGNLTARSGYASGNEIGVLAASFDDMAGTIEAEMGLRERAAQIAAAIAAETEPREFCRRLVRTLAQQTGSQMAALYLLNEQQSAFEHFESIGLDDRARAAFSAELPEGEFGMALATGEIQHITEVPDSTRFAFASVGGEVTPREIVTIPVLSDGRPISVISLATIGGYDATTIRLMSETLPAISARLNGALLFRRTRRLAEQLNHQNTELAAQKNELSMQTNELVEMNSELEEQKRQLEVADRLKSTFLSNMSHELRTPLNSVIALSGVLGRRLAGTIPNEEHDYLEIIERNGRHLLDLINDILDISRIEAGREEVDLSSFTVRRIVAEVVDTVAPLAEEKGLALTNQVSEDLPQLCSDREKVRHIVQNLVGNAVKFTDTGSVVISASRTDHTLRIVVRDTGIGISAKQLPLIFDEFHRGDVSASRRHGGTGLGLSIARKYAEMLHGSVSVTSTPSEGSAFTLELPFDAFGYETRDTDTEPAGTEPTALSSPAGGTAVSAPADGTSILVVEDSEAIIVQMTEMLAGQGYRVRVARNGVEALASIEEAIPDAVILDLVMPVMDGFELLVSLRAMEKTATLPVLILTARQVSREEFGVLKQNHVRQLIRKGDVDRKALLAAVAGLVRPVGAKAPVEESAQTERLPQGRPVVLVVEDNPDSMLTARALLQDRCTVLEATDGREGVEQARRHVPDLILMDLALPELDGFGALQCIREDEALCGVPVVAVTASAMKGDREDILARGFDAYLSKPIDEEQLRKTLREMLREKGLTL